MSLFLFNKDTDACCALREQETLATVFKYNVDKIKGFLLAGFRFKAPTHTYATHSLSFSN